MAGTEAAVSSVDYCMHTLISLALRVYVAAGQGSQPSVLHGQWALHSTGSNDLLQVPVFIELSRAPHFLAQFAARVAQDLVAIIMSLIVVKGVCLKLT